MLKINKRFFKEFRLPELSLPKQLQFDTIVDDGDELIQAINNDPVANDDVWELAERPSEEELARADRVWNQMLDDVRNDSEWFREEVS